MTRVAINGFGRIGRLTFRQIMAEQDGLDVVAINDVGGLDNLAYLLRHDTVYRAPVADISASDSTLVWNGKEIRVTQETDPAYLPWNELEVETVIESTGKFTDREGAAKHLSAGAERVIISAPAKSPDVTICMGVNEEKFEPGSHKVISNASCTTNCLAPVAKVLDEEFGIVTGFLTTVHGVTSGQAQTDGPKKDWRRGRAGSYNIIPTTTGATRAVAETLPQLQGKMSGLAMRVPVAAGSVIDFVVNTDKPVTVESVNEAFRKHAKSEHMRGILAIVDDQLVSSDIIQSTFSAIVDAPLTAVLNERTVKVIAWYDNEWGYSRRLLDLTRYTSQQAQMKKAA